MPLPYRTVYTLTAAELPPYLIGPPGKGKSTGIAAMAREWGKATQVYTMFVAQHDPITLGSGVPVKDETNGVFILLPWDRAMNLFTDPKAWLFIDELPDGDVDQQRAVSPIILNRKIGDIPIACTIVTAGNPPKYGANELDPRLANRVVPVEWNMGATDFVKGLRSGWDMGKPPTIPKDWAKQIPSKLELVAQYLEQFPNQFDEATGTPDFPAYPTARSWEFAIRFLACAEGAQLSRKDTQIGMEGCVGRGVGAQFMLWNRHGGIDVKAIIADPTKLKKLKDSDPATIDAVFEAVNAYTAEGNIQGTECGAFYSAALKYEYAPDLVLRHARAVSAKLKEDIRQQIFNEIAVRRGGN